MNFSRLVIFLTCWNFTDAGKEPALFLDWERQELVEIRKFDDISSCKCCISACPVAPNSISETLLNDKISITKKSLFLRHVYHENNGQDTFANEMEIEICNKSLTPALARDCDSGKHLVGYELYYEKGSMYQHLYEEFGYVNFFYKKPEERYSFNRVALPEEESRLEVDELATSSSNYKCQATPLDDEFMYQKIRTSVEQLIKVGRHGYKKINFEIKAEPEKKWHFYWISVLSITISEDQKHRYISFQSDKINDYFHKVGTIYYCKTYFGEDGEEMENTNGPENDLGIQVFDAKPEMEKKSKELGDRLVKTQIIPMHMFHTMAARRATCVHLNFAFIWETIANESLKKIDLFVYAIYRERLRWSMDIYFGVYGDSKELNQVKENNDILNKYSAPKVIFRLITIFGLNWVHYGVVIVIHNVLTPVKDSDRVCSTKDEVEGWDDIKNTDSVTGFSYTCPHTEQVLSKLGFDEKFAYKNMELLKLNKYPKRNDKTGLTEYINFLDTVRSRLNLMKN